MYKQDIIQIKNQQQTHQAILVQIEDLGNSSDDLENPENSGPKSTDEQQVEGGEQRVADGNFITLINRLTIQKFYINIRIRIDDFVLDTIALFDTGADSNCILEGSVPTKYFEKTTEKLSSANGSRLKIRYKLSEALIENGNSQVKTSFLLFFLSKISKMKLFWEPLS